MGTAAGLVVLFFSVYPIPSGPDGKAVIVGLLRLLVGFGVMAYHAMRHPDLLKVAGRSRE